MASSSTCRCPPTNCICLLPHYDIMSHVDAETYFLQAAQEYNEIKSTGVTFGEIKYFGFVPILKDVSDYDENQQRDLLLTCIETVVKAEHHGRFSELLKNQIVGPYFRFPDIEINLTLSRFTASIYNFEDIETKLMLRCLITKILFYIFHEVDKEVYFAFVSSTNGKLEVSVIQIWCKTTINNIKRILDEMKKLGSQIPTNINDRLRAIQDFKIDRSYCSFYHDKLDKDNLPNILKNHGDFLFRPHDDVNKTEITVTVNNEGKIEHMERELSEESMFNMVRKIQLLTDMVESYKHPVPKVVEKKYYV